MSNLSNIQQTGPVSTSGKVTSESWAVALLSAAGLPVTQNNVDNIMRWMQLENSNGATFLHNGRSANNPLNIKPGGVLGSFSNVQLGVYLTSQVLRQSNMNVIYDALKNNAPWPAFAQALVQSPWDGGHYGGNAQALANVPMQNGNSGTVQGSGAGQTSVAGNIAHTASKIAAPEVKLISSAGHILSDLASASWWKRLGIGVAGVALVGVGIILLNRKSIGDAAEAAGKVAEVA